ncbi:hypothetical protein DH2020_016108 [Rehmannia glutinosa]|uniref:Protein kinase domain-containing protein n=1 Tax=Rehmannia glutinosa TaxID=99300 RepID=A0ABR0WV25_REHGL
MAGKEKKGVNEYGDGLSWIRGPVLGKGGFGRVYLTTLKNRISKYSCLPPVMAVKSAEVSVSSTLQKEMEIMRNLNVCPYVINCFGEETTMGENGVMAYNMLLEYGSGGTLAYRIKKLGLPELEVRAHTRGGKTEFRAKIRDFGLAKRVKQSRKRKLEESYWRGTPMYLSSEAVIDSMQEAPCDVWAVGGYSCKDRGGNELPKIPNEVSKEARDFLKRCFMRKSIPRSNKFTGFKLEIHGSCVDSLIEQPKSSTIKTRENGNRDHESSDDQALPVGPRDSIQQNHGHNF